MSENIKIPFDSIIFTIDELIFMKDNRVVYKHILDKPMTITDSVLVEDLDGNLNVKLSTIN